MNDCYPANRTELFLSRIFISYCFFFCQGFILQFWQFILPGYPEIRHVGTSGEGPLEEWELQGRDPWKNENLLTLSCYF